MYRALRSGPQNNRANSIFVYNAICKYNLGLITYAEQESVAVTSGLRKMIYLS